MKNLSHKLLSLTFAAVCSISAISSISPMSHAVAAEKSSSAESKSTRSWVSLKISTDQRRYSVGQPIQVHLTATNNHTSGAYLRFTSGQRFDFSAYPANKKDSAYSWSASRSFMQGTGSLWLKPGQSQEYDAAIGDEMGQLKPGKYYLFAHLTNSPSIIFAEPTSFEVVDPGVAITTTTDKTTYKAGESVHVYLDVANTKLGTARLPFRSSQIFDVVITDATEKPVWNYGALIRFAQNQHDEIWTKGEVKKYSTSWNGTSFQEELAKAKPGGYRVQAILQSSPLVYAAPVYIDITE